MISFLKIPRDAAERMYLFGPGEHHRNWWPESRGWAEKHFRRQMKARMDEVKTLLAKERERREIVE